jgi:hypothetical protein
LKVITKDKKIELLEDMMRSCIDSMRFTHSFLKNKGIESDEIKIVYESAGELLKLFNNNKDKVV